LKDQVITSEKIIDEAIVETLRTPDKNGPTGPALSPIGKPVEDDTVEFSNAYFGQNHDNSGQNIIASDVTTKSVETSLPAKNTVKHDSAPPKNVVLTSNPFAKFSDTDDDVKDEDSTYAHCNMAQSVITHDQPSVTLPRTTNQKIGTMSPTSTTTPTTMHLYVTPMIWQCVHLLFKSKI